MRKSILALAVGGLLAGAAVVPVPASAHTTVLREGVPARVVVVKPAKKKVVVVKPAKKKVVIHRASQPRRVVVVHRDGSRTVRVVRPRSQVAVIRER